MLTTVAAGRVYNHSYCIGMFSLSGMGFWAPLDFAVGSNGVLYVVNRGDAESLGQRVSKCTMDHQHLSQFGTFGSGDGEFVWPVSVDLDREENVYVSDEHLHRISIFDKDGSFLGKWGTPGSGAGELNGPSGIAFDREDNLYIVDSLNNRVQKFTKDGKFLGKWEPRGNGDGQLNMPWGICLDSVGDVYVADWKGSCVRKYSPDGEPLARFGRSEAGVGELNRPTGVAVDSDGDVYVTDWGSHRLQVFAPDGAFITSLVGDAQQPSPWAQTFIDANPEYVKARRRVSLEPEWRFRRPVAVNVDAQDRILVLESGMHRIQVYQKEKDYEEAPLNS